MPVFSMACSKCGKQATEYAEDKWQCLNCGIKFVYKDEGPPVVNVHQVYRSAENAQAVLCCPKCGPTNVQFKKMVYQAGTQESSTAAVGVGVGAGGLGVGGLSGFGVSTSLLAKRCSPPAKPGRAVAVVIGVVGFFITLGAIAPHQPSTSGIDDSTNAAPDGRLFLGLIGVGLVATGIVLDKRYRSLFRNYAVALRRWREEVICLVCGNEFLTRKGQEDVLGHWESLAAEKQLETERELDRRRKRLEQADAFRAWLGKARQGVNTSVYRAFGGTVRLPGRIAGGPENAILHGFLRLFVVGVLVCVLVVGILVLVGKL